MTTFFSKLFGTLFTTKSTEDDGNGKTFRQCIEDAMVPAPWNHICVYAEDGTEQDFWGRPISLDFDEDGSLLLTDEGMDVFLAHYPRGAWKRVVDRYRS